MRISDPGIDGWHIIWTDPLNQDYSRQIGRAKGSDIVQIGEDTRGLKTRWRSELADLQIGMRPAPRGAGLSLSAIFARSQISVAIRGVLMQKKRKRSSGFGI